MPKDLTERAGAPAERASAGGGWGVMCVCVCVCVVIVFDQGGCGIKGFVRLSPLL